MEEHRAYIGKLCAEMQVQNEASLLRVEQDFTQSDHFRKACRFGGDAVRNRLSGYRLQRQYDIAVGMMNSADNETAFSNAAARYDALGDYQDAAQRAAVCWEKAVEYRMESIYSSAVRMMQKGSESELERAAKRFSDIPDYKDAAELCRQCKDQIEALQAARKAERERQEQERIAEEQKQKQKKKLIALISVIAAVLVVAAIIIVPMIVKA